MEKDLKVGDIRLVSRQIAFSQKENSIQRFFLCTPSFVPNLTITILQANDSGQVVGI